MTHAHLTHPLDVLRRQELIAEAQRARTAAPVRRRTRRGLLAVLAAAATVTAAALPAAADAATATVVGTELQVIDRTGVANDMTIALRSDGRSLVTDARDALSPGAGCQPTAGGVLCSGANRLGIALGAGDDRLTNAGAGPTRYLAGAGDDVLVTGTSVGPSLVAFSGGDGRDTVSYAGAGRGVTVTKDGEANDGRTGADGDQIGDDVEVLQGSRFADELVGGFHDGDRGARVAGLGGDDRLRGGRGNDIFLAGPLADGADHVDGGLGFDTIDYRARTNAVTVTVDVGAADDGEAGERDDVRATEQLLSGPGADTLRGNPTSTADASFVAGAGVDAITGTDGRDLITPGAGRDTVDARGGADVVRARDGEVDTVACGAGLDTLQSDSAPEIATGCETVEGVGTLSVAPRVVRTQATALTRLGLTWRHPRSWSQVRTLTVHMRDGLVPVAAVTVRPHDGDVRATGAVTPARRATRIGRSGRSVRARLALRLDPSLAGRRLVVDVEATDRSGRRQLERGAAAISVAD